MISLYDSVEQTGENCDMKPWYDSYMDCVVLLVSPYLSICFPNLLYE